MQYLNPSTQKAGEQTGLPSNFQASQSCDLTRSCLKNKIKYPDVPGFVMHTWHPSLEGGRRIRSRGRPGLRSIQGQPGLYVTLSQYHSKLKEKSGFSSKKAIAARTDNQFYSWDSRSGKRTDSYNQFLTSTHEPWHMCTSPTNKLQIKF